MAFNPTYYICPECKKKAAYFTKQEKWWCTPKKGGCNENFEADDKRLGPSAQTTSNGDSGNSSSAFDMNAFLSAGQTLVFMREFARMVAEEVVKTLEKKQ